MYDNPFVTQLLVEERKKDAIRHSEQARLIQAAEGSEMGWRWQLPMIPALKSLSALLMRPQRKRLTANTPNL
jgi:hypothetical protein